MRVCERWLVKCQLPSLHPAGTLNLQTSPTRGKPLDSALSEPPHVLSHPLSFPESCLSPKNSKKNIYVSWARVCVESGTKFWKVEGFFCMEQQTKHRVGTAFLFCFLSSGYRLIFTVCCSPTLAVGHMALSRSIRSSLKGMGCAKIYLISCPRKCCIPLPNMLRVALLPVWLFSSTSDLLRDLTALLIQLFLISVAHTLRILTQTQIVRKQYAGKRHKCTLIKNHTDDYFTLV